MSCTLTRTSSTATSDERELGHPIESHSRIMRPVKSSDAPDDTEVSETTRFETKETELNFLKFNLPALVLIIFQ